MGRPFPVSGHERLRQVNSGTDSGPGRIRLGTPDDEVDQASRNEDLLDHLALLQVPGSVTGGAGEGGDEDTRE